MEINDHLIAFYAGRDWTRIRAEHNWLDDGAMKLGMATYAVHKNNRAVIYDTFADIRQARWVRTYLEHRGITQFTVVLSHWHLDHIAGNAVYCDSHIISNALTRALLVQNKTKIETGCSDGPPEINPLILPDITFDRTMTLHLEDLHLELMTMDIHSRDGTLLYLPGDSLLLAGDMLEDTVTYIEEADHLAEHVNNLKKLRQLPLARILPNHGDPDVIDAGGYDTTLIDATIHYITRMVGRSHDTDFLKSPMESFLEKALEQGWVHYYEPYEAVHRENLRKVQDHYKNIPIPFFAGA